MRRVVSLDITVVSVPFRGFSKRKVRRLKQLLREDSEEGFRKPLF